MRRITKGRYFKPHWNKIIPFETVEDILFMDGIIRNISTAYNLTFSDKHLRQLAEINSPSIASFYSNLPASKMYSNHVGFALENAVPNKTLHLFVRGFRKDFEKITSGTKDKKLTPVLKKKGAQFVLENRALFCGFVCFLNNHRSIDEILKDAKNGNDKNLFQLVQIDKTIINEDWVKKRIYEASLKNEGLFFLNLGRSLQKDTISSKRKHLRPLLAIAILDSTGLISKLTYNLIADFFSDKDIALMNEADIKMLMKEYRSSPK